MMRHAAFAFLGLLVACSGEVAPDNSGKTTSPQAAGDAEKDNGNGTPPATTTTSSGSSQGDSVHASAEYSEAACWSYGAEAEGECTIGQKQYCDGYFESTSSSGSTAPFCVQVCVNVDGKAVWSEKSNDRSCPFFDSKYHVDKPGCSCEDFGRAQQRAQQNSSSTPLVLTFDDGPVSFTTNAGGAFDLVADGQCHGSDWPSAATPWLALDRDGNGAIDDGSELFGSAVRLSNGLRAKNGFEALRDLDSNHDGVFDANDDAFAKVVVWSDRNGDRRSTPSELTSLAEAGVTSISLSDRVDQRCDARGNCERERSSFTMTNGRRASVVDVYVKTR